jgi:hypothetical protein
MKQEDHLPGVRPTCKPRVLCRILTKSWGWMGRQPTVISLRAENSLLALSVDETAPPVPARSLDGQPLCMLQFPRTVNSSSDQALLGGLVMNAPSPYLVASDV